MAWQDALIAISNVGFIIALLPLLLSLFGIKTVELGLVMTGVIYGSFLILAAIGIFSLGAYFGGIATLMGGIMWYIIAGTAWIKVR
jgi:hypothetical protein